MKSLSTKARLRWVASAFLSACSAIWGLSAGCSPAETSIPENEDGGGYDATAVLTPDAGALVDSTRADDGTAGRDAGPPPDESLDADVADGEASSVDSGDADASERSCAIESETLCGPDPLCCSPIQGYRYDPNMDCKATAPTALLCRGKSLGSTKLDCPTPDQMEGCWTLNGEVYLLTQGGGAAPSGFGMCSDATREKASSAPGCP